MKKFAFIIALVVSLGLVCSLATPASAFFFGGFGKANCGAVCAPMYCAPVYCAPAVCVPYCAPYCGPVYPCKVKKGKKIKMK
ncbi:MAG TPA: hypothetical protein VK463_12180 [Desulfomonilaceae bacterium]|nr:hypothetical protein [Desulfomonilaceae bacterium]